jgi:hypothetical protein
LFRAPGRGILLEQADEWTVAEHRHFGAEPMARLAAPPKTASTHELLTAIA